MELRISIFYIAEIKAADLRQGSVVGFVPPWLEGKQKIEWWFWQT